MNTWIRRLVLAAMLSTACVLSQAAGAEQATVKDSEGNLYGVVRIGHLYWMNDNLRASTFRNGDTIVLISGQDEWSARGASGEPLRSLIDDSEDAFSTLGHLYNWHAVSDQRGLCPAGWRIPTRQDWLSLVPLLGLAELAPGANVDVYRGSLSMLAIQQTSGRYDFRTPDNRFGFSIPAGGYRFHSGLAQLEHMLSPEARNGFVPLDSNSTSLWTSSLDRRTRRPFASHLDSSSSIDTFSMLPVIAENGAYVRCVALANDLTTPDNRLSYTIGMDIGQSLSEQGIPLNMSLLVDANRCQSRASP